MHRAKASCRENRVIKPIARKSQTSANVLEFKVRMLSQNLFTGKIMSEQVQHVGDANPHAPNTWTPAALFRIDRDTFHQGGHNDSLPKEAYIL